ncbi:hypothetical protein PENSOL_c011G04869 [Penicillium solitum]|uniref:Uncharacterized protein n=1 Tax=Penicillium solitum TaxID=60172 RepID=A0A1V6R917_9EURO|nr:uncharacterized protein PENSOL_c011G04869 [Penicillium solitum]OQD97706.1 hypothetical protein PENSOL_c011G04869 [Penicillium solitum]
MVPFPRGWRVFGGLACPAGRPCSQLLGDHVISPPPRSWGIAEGGMVGLLNTQMATFVPCGQPLGDDIMLESPRGWLVFLLRAQQADHADGIRCTIMPAPGRSYNVPCSQELPCCCRWHGRPAEHGDGSFVPCGQPLGDDIMLESPRGWLVFLLRVQRTNHADGVVLVGPLNTQMAAAVPCFQPLGDIMLESPRGWLVFLLRAQQADHADGIRCTIMPAPGRPYNVPCSQELPCCCRWHGRPAEHGDGSFVPCGQPLGDDIMLESPRGWLVFLLRAQQADHADGIRCTIMPAPGRSYNTLRSQELACCWWNCMAGLLNTQAVLYIVIVV